MDKVLLTSADPQDLHIHTTFSTGDSQVAPEQSIELISSIRHAKIVGISDHLEYVSGKNFEPYELAVRKHKFHLGCEVDGSAWVDCALEHKFDYFVYHCRNSQSEYAGAQRLLERSGKNVIVAHPLTLDSQPDKVPTGCLIEINNRYVWRNDWRNRLVPFVQRFEFVISSDAHRPNWLGQRIARWVAAELGIREKMLF